MKGRNKRNYKTRRKRRKGRRRKKGKDKIKSSSSFLPSFPSFLPPFLPSSLYPSFHLPSFLPSSHRLLTANINIAFITTSCAYLSRLSLFPYIACPRPPCFSAAPERSGRGHVAAAPPSFSFYYYYYYIFYRLYTSLSPPRRYLSVLTVGD